MTPANHPNHALCSTPRGEPTSFAERPYNAIAVLPLTSALLGESDLAPPVPPWTSAPLRKPIERLSNEQLLISARAREVLPDHDRSKYAQVGDVPQLYSTLVPLFATLLMKFGSNYCTQPRASRCLSSCPRVPKSRRCDPHGHVNLTVERCSPGRPFRESFAACLSFTLRRGRYCWDGAKRRSPLPPCKICLNRYFLSMMLFSHHNVLYNNHSFASNA